VTIIGSCIFAAPATIPQHRSAIPTAVILGAWSLVVSILGLRTLKQVGVSNCGVLAPVLVLLVGVQSAMFFAMAYGNLDSHLKGHPLPPSNATLAALRCIAECVTNGIAKGGVVPETEEEVRAVVRDALPSYRARDQIRRVMETWMDGWGRRLRCEFPDDGSARIVLRSAGADGEFSRAGTADDVVEAVR
jgi:hypothetical protein